MKGNDNKIAIFLKMLLLLTLSLPEEAMKSQNSTKIQNVILQNNEKQIVGCDSTAKEVSFEWSHLICRILSTKSKVRTSYESIIHTGSERVNIKPFNV